MALHQLAAKASSSFSLFDIAPPSPTPQVFLLFMCEVTTFVYFDFSPLFVEQCVLCYHN